MKAHRLGLHAMNVRLRSRKMGKNRDRMFYRLRIEAGRGQRFSNAAPVHVAMVAAARPMMLVARNFLVAPGSNSQ